MAPGLGRAKIVGAGSFLLVYRRVVAHWRAIILLLILAVATVPIAYGDFFDLITLALFLLFIASQIFWIGRILDLGERFNPGKPRRAWLAIMAGLVYLFVFLRNDPGGGLCVLYSSSAAPHPRQGILFYPAVCGWVPEARLALLLLVV